MVAAAVIGGAALAGGAAISSSSAKKAAKTQSAATDRASDTQKQMYDQTREDLQPYTQAGVNAVGGLSNLMGLGNSSSYDALKQDPSYQFRLNQGLDNVQSSAAGRGSLLSGATLKALNNYSQDYASQEYGNAYNRLMGLSQLGQNSAAQVGNTGASVAQGIANNTIGGANATAAGQIQSGNAWSSALGSFAKMIGGSI